LAGAFGSSLAEFSSWGFAPFFLKDDHALVRLRQTRSASLQLIAFIL
jgi:hypothetical protein